MCAAFFARLAAVESERAERAFEERILLVVARRLAAQRVEVGLVAVDRAAHRSDAVGVHELRDERRDARADAAVVAVDERAVAERRIAAAVQVEVAFPDAVRAELAGAQHGRRELRGRTELLERRRRRVELLDRGRRAFAAGAR
jgi:hypothetical protein